jgi:hypothetical protein
MKTKHKKTGFEKLFWNSILIISALLLLSSAALSQAYPNPGHPAYHISGGSFNESFGDFYFPVGLKVGIGIVSASSTLTVNGTGNDATDGGILIQGSDAGANATLYFRQDADYMDARIKWAQTGSISRIGFYLDNSAGGYVDYNERLTIREDGNIGINSTDPGEALYVDGSINVTAGNDVCISDGSGCLTDPDSYPGNCSADAIRVGDSCLTMPDCDSSTQTLNYDNDSVSPAFSCGDDDQGGSMYWWDLYDDDTPTPDHATIDDGDTVDIEGGTGISTSISGSTLTITNDGDTTDDGTIADDDIALGTETTGPYADSNAVNGSASDIDCEGSPCITLDSETSGAYCAKSSCADGDADPTNETQDIWSRISSADDATYTDPSTYTDTLTITGSGPISTARSGDTITITSTPHPSDTNANTACSGTWTYLDGAGNCDNFDTLYINEAGDSSSGNYNFDSGTLYISTSAMGVGTTSPGSTLTVGGSGDSSSRIDTSTDAWGAGGDYGIYASSSDTTFGFTALAGRASSTGYGVWGTIGVTSGGYCFYAGGTGNYNPFTGTHDVIVYDDFPEDALTGMLVSVTGETKIRRDNQSTISLSTTLPTARLSDKANDKAVYGAFGSIRPVNDEDFWYELKEGERVGAVNALGDGKLLVTNITGDIEDGDYITTSDIPGYGQKQDDDLMHLYTAAKSTQDLDWSEVSDEELAGTVEYQSNTYKTYLLSVVYVSG